MRTRIILLSLAALMTVACSSVQQDEIERTAQSYLEAAGDYRLDDAMPYASKHTRNVVLPFYKNIMERADTNYINSNRPADITIQSSRMLSDTTALVYYHKHTPIKDVDDSVLVVLEDGQWLVHINIAIPGYLLTDSTIARRPTRQQFKQLIHTDTLPHRIRQR